MAKLYAELYSDKGGRVIGKGGDNLIGCTITKNGKVIATVECYDCVVHVSDVTEEQEVVINGFQVQ